MKTRELKFLGILAVLFLMGCGEEAVTPGQVVGGDGEAYAAIAQGQPGSASGTTPAEQTGFGTGTAGESSEEGSGDSTPSMGWGTPAEGESGSGGQNGGAADGGGQDGGTPASFCTSNEECPAETPFCSAGGVCVQCTEDGDCAAGNTCNLSICVPSSCTPGQTLCANTTLLTCETGGTSWATLTCPGAQGTCQNGACTGCDPGASTCSGKDQVLTCLPDGSGLVQETCSSGVCVGGVCAECYPGTKQCDGDWAQTCGAAGLWEDTQNCLSLGGECSNGTCSSACGATGKLSNEGCDYWVVDMDNKGAAADSPYAVIVSNLNTTPVSVTVSAQAGAGQAPATVASGTVAPGDLEIFQLPQQNMGETGIFWKAARVEATGPIVAYQFNPLENVDVFSNDASLLLPSNTFGTEYIVVSREEIPSDKYGAFRGSVSIVATSAETEVTVVPSAPIRAGSTVPALAIGQSHTVVLQPYQVLNLQSDALGSDLTGTIVTSTKPVAVFGGHEAAVGDQQCCADHLEQQLFPVSTWGKNYVASKSKTRGIERDYWRFVASENGTSITLNPALPGVPNPITLNRGQFHEVHTDQDFVVTATAPILVAQTLASSKEIAGPPECSTNSDCADGYSCSWVSPECMLDSPYCSSDAQCPGSHSCRCDALGFCTCEPVGDPTLILSVPTEQFRDSYVFLTPTNFVEDYINVVAPAGATVTLDGNPVADAKFTPLSGSNYKVARLPVIDGVHTLFATEPVGVVAYGYDEDVSYGYPAGLSLEAQP